MREREKQYGKPYASYASGRFGNLVDTAPMCRENAVKSTRERADASTVPTLFLYDIFCLGVFKNSKTSNTTSKSSATAIKMICHRLR